MGDASLLLLNFSAYCKTIRFVMFLMVIGLEESMLPLFSKYSNVHNTLSLLSQYCDRSVILLLVNKPFAIARSSLTNSSFSMRVTN